MKHFMKHFRVYNNLRMQVFKMCTPLGDPYIQFNNLWVTKVTQMQQGIVDLHFKGQVYDGT